MSSQAEQKHGIRDGFSGASPVHLMLVLSRYAETTDETTDVDLNKPGVHKAYLLSFPEWEQPSQHLPTKRVKKTVAIF